MQNQTESSNLSGLKTAEVEKLREKYGSNDLIPEQKQNFFRKLLRTLGEPMFILLFAAGLIYFILGEPRDGIIMMVFVVFVLGIDVFQEWKTDKTLLALKDLSNPKVMVLRDGNRVWIDGRDVLPGELMFLEEGQRVPADGVILELSDFCVDESSLTGESEPVWKTITDDSDCYWKRNCCYAGTLITQGSAAVRVQKTGTSTEYGKIGQDIAEAPERPTPLEKQTRVLVKQCTVLGFGLFILVAIITYLNVSSLPFVHRIIDGVLAGVTLAMAMIPEEFPVILTVFLSMGAWRLAKKSALIRRLPSVETLGAVSILCVDKTGTLTKNKMEVRDCWVAQGDNVCLCTVMGRACEMNAYDPMELAMLSYCKANGLKLDEIFENTLLYEYSFTSETKMMGHIWKMQDGSVTLSAKGSPEAILPLCNLDAPILEQCMKEQERLALRGLRVIAIAEAPVSEHDIPEDLNGHTLHLIGLVGLADPPREAVPDAVKTCAQAGIRVIMITGDNGTTALSIANQIGLKNDGTVITGDQLESMSDEELISRIRTASIFARVIPKHKMRIVKAFKNSGAIVAMTGDGVNDAPALKYADIGIAMGKRGTQVAREAADMVLLDDNFETIVDTIADGRRIYDNIRKAIGYVFAIHIPIALASLLAPLMRIPSTAIMLLPVHIVLLELIIDPTCSIVFERQKAEKDIMERPPRNIKQPLVKKEMTLRAILQGFAMFLASFGIYYWNYTNGISAEISRTMALCVLAIGNILLVQVTSEERSLWLETGKAHLKDGVMWLINGGVALGLLLIIYVKPVYTALKLYPLTIWQLLFCILLAGASVLWWEAVKLLRIFRGEKHR